MHVGSTSNTLRDVQYSQIHGDILQLPHPLIKIFLICTGNFGNLYLRSHTSKFNNDSCTTPRPTKIHISFKKTPHKSSTQVRFTPLSVVILVSTTGVGLRLQRCIDGPSELKMEILSAGN